MADKTFRASEPANLRGGGPEGGGVLRAPPEVMACLALSQPDEENIGWLAGHGYNGITVAIPTQHHSAPQGWLRGNFLPVGWENLAAPLLTGREELGCARIYADIP